MSNMKSLIIATLFSVSLFVLAFVNVGINKLPNEYQVSSYSAGKEYNVLSGRDC